MSAFDSRVDGQVLVAGLVYIYSCISTSLFRCAFKKLKPYSNKDLGCGDLFIEATADEVEGVLDSVDYS